MTWHGVLGDPEQPSGKAAATAKFAQADKRGDENIARDVLARRSVGDPDLNDATRPGTDRNLHRGRR
jgi:hypothetical protein